MSKLSLILCTFNITGLVAGLFLTHYHIEEESQGKEADFSACQQAHNIIIIIM